MLAHSAELLGTSAATALLNLRKFYKRIDHRDLYRTAVHHHFNPQLLRGLRVGYA